MFITVKVPYVGGVIETHLINTSQVAWVYPMRDGSGHAFIELSNGSTVNTIESMQAIASKLEAAQR